MDTIVSDLAVGRQGEATRTARPVQNVQAASAMMRTTAPVPTSEPTRTVRPPAIAISIDPLLAREFVSARGGGSLIGRKAGAVARGAPARGDQHRCNRLGSRQISR